jgi:hypothetical protein
MGFLWGKRPAAPKPVAESGSWLVITEPGPGRGLAQVGEVSGSTVMLQTKSARVQYAAADLPRATRPVLSRAEAEARLAELSTPSTLDPRHPNEQHIEFLKVVSRGTDEDVVALLRRRYAQTWGLRFGDRKALDQLEQRVLPELAHVLGRSEDELRTAMRERHALMTANGPPPDVSDWPGETTAEKVPLIDGLEVLGTMQWGDRLFIGPRLDRQGEPETGIVELSIEPGEWNAWLELGEEEEPRTLVLIRSGEPLTWPPSSRQEVASGRAWQLAPGANLQVMDHAALTDGKVMDAARYLAGTQVYWGKAVSVAALDGLPDTFAIHAPPGTAPHRALAIELAVASDTAEE